MKTIRVLFVCLGNICRSPTAHGVLLAKLVQAGLAQQVEVDSCGTAAWHTGKAPDARSSQHAASRGYDLSTLRARQLCEADFDHFDYILAMDSNNLADIQALQPAHSQAHVSLFLDYGDSPEHEVPDPYYGGEVGFEHVLDLVESACDGLLAKLRLDLS